MSKRLLPSDEKIIKLYVDDKKSCKEICRMYGLSENSSSNIGIRLKKLGISIRKDAGKNHHNWKGGKIIKGDGYIGIWNPSHERSDKQGYVYEHTLVYENYNGVLPSDGEVIHHIDMDKSNNDIKNLYLFKNAKEHAISHRSLEKIVKTLLEKNIIYFKDGIYKIKENL